MKRHLALFVTFSSLLGGVSCVDQAAYDAEDEFDTSETVELETAPEPGKEDGAGLRGLPVDGNYADSQAWEVKNQWEDRTTPAARKAGLAWPANSGLSWDEKYSRWIGSLKMVPSATSTFYQTIEITTPWGKVLPSAKLDCADATLALRATFAAWYQLPFMISAGANPTIHFGHFGAQTKNGRWDQAVKIAQVYPDYSANPPARLRDWPKDARLRKMHLHGKTGETWQDEIPYYLPNNHEGTGAWLDELHLNKRAARLIMYLLAYTGSANVADSNNTFNLQPNAIRPGDTLLWRRSPRGTGHTMVMIRVKDLSGGQKEAQNIFGNEPPAQLYVESPSATRGNLMRNEGGGEGVSQDGVTPYAKAGGGLKRWRVAKNKDGFWVNTWMSGDEANWIDSTYYARIAARPKQFGNLLGTESPGRLRDELFAQIELKREHLRNNPSSCSARASREELFGRLIAHNAAHFGMSAEETERKYRSVEDYVYAPLEYAKSRTCCWNSSNRAMHETIMKYVAKQQLGNACATPPPFKMTDGTFGAYEAFARANNLPWATWRADEECQATDDTDELDTSAAPIVGVCELEDL